MKKVIKLLQAFVLVLVLLVSLPLGILRPISTENEISYSYFTYSAEGQTYSWKKYEDKLVLSSEEGDTECEVDGNTIQATLGGSQISALMSEDGSTIRVTIDDGESGSGEPNYTVFNRSGEATLVTELQVIRYGDKVVEFLNLSGFEELVGEHYFNSIFSAISANSLTALIFIIYTAIKKHKRSNKKKDKGKNESTPSIVSPIPNPSSPSVDQKGPGIKF